MINSLKKWLVCYDYIKPGDDCKLSFRLCGNWSVLCYVNGTLNYFIKIENFGSIQEEFSTLEFMHTMMPQYVLKPLAIDTWDNHRIYIQQAVEHQMLSTEVWLKSQDAHEHMMTFLLSIAGLQLKNTCHIDERLIAPYKKYCPQHYDEVLQRLSLPQVLQHGDLSLNNIGIHADRLTVFDWEDYGLSAFPLMDVTVFLSSLCNFDSDTWLNFSSDKALPLWLEPMLDIFDISFDEFVYCMPYALMVFVSLKQQLGYGPDIIQKVDIMIKSLAKAQEGVVCA